MAHGFGRGLKINMAKDAEKIKKKIRFHAARRSSLELEMVLNKFLDRHLDAFSYNELISVEKLLSMDDLELSKAIFKKKMPPVGIEPELWKKILDAIFE